MKTKPQQQAKETSEDVWSNLPKGPQDRDSEYATDEGVEQNDVDALQRQNKGWSK